MLPSLTVKERALDLGFDLAGIAPLGVWKDLEFSRQWVERGFNGEMRYLENPKRFDPRLVLPSAKSVICVGLVYSARHRSQKSGVRSQNEQPPSGGIAESGDSSATPATGNSAQPTTDDGQRAAPSLQSPVSSFEFPISSFHFPTPASLAPRAWISRYAWGHDYHGIMGAKLEQLRAAVEELVPGVETRGFVDTGPVIERAFARFSGIGWMGKNTCIINQEKGSWFFLGVILTSLELAPDLPAPDRCGSCTACLEACPTGALVEPYVMDASRCISYLTIELKRSIPEQFRPKIGGNIFGCDICQDVCPWNNSRQSSVLSYQQVPSRQRRSAFSYQPSVVSYQQTASPQLHSSDKSCVRQAATTKVPQFRPMIVELTHAGLSDGGAPEQLTTDNAARTTDNGPPTTENHQLRQTSFQFPVSSFSLFHPPLHLLASISEEDFRRIFAHSPIKRAKYRGWLRNLCVAMGNSGDERFMHWLERAAQHSAPIVREHAAWALERLRRK